MNTNGDQQDLAWKERSTIYGQAYDLENSPSGSCGYSVLRITHGRSPTLSRRASRRFAVLSTTVLISIALLMTTTFFVG